MKTRVVYYINAYCPGAPEHRSAHSSLREARMIAQALAVHYGKVLISFVLGTRLYLEEVRA
jgi:hypothetical protein